MKTEINVVKYYLSREKVSFGLDGDIKINTLDFVYYPSLQVIETKQSIIINNRLITWEFIVLKEDDYIQVGDLRITFKGSIITANLTLETNFLQVPNLKKRIKSEYVKPFEFNPNLPNEYDVPKNFYLLRCLTMIASLVISILIIINRQNTSLGLLLISSLIISSFYGLVTSFTNYLTQRNTYKLQKKFANNQCNQTRLEFLKTAYYHNQLVLQTCFCYQTIIDHPHLVIDCNRDFNYQNSLYLGREIQQKSCMNTNIDVYDNVYLHILDWTIIYCTYSIWLHFCSHLIFQLVVKNIDCKVIILTNKPANYRHLTRCKQLISLDNKLGIYTRFNDELEKFLSITTDKIFIISEFSLKIDKTKYKSIGVLQRGWNKSQVSGNSIFLSNGKGLYLNSTGSHEFIVDFPLTINQIHYSLRKMTIKKNNLNSQINNDLLCINKLCQFTPDQLFNRWQQNYQRNNFITTFGIVNNEPIAIDISENGIGPHGIIIGATGSGKSQLIQSFIVSLCLNYSPNQLQIVYIDFKGGVDAQALESFPHIDQIIVNDNLFDTNKSIVSIQQEIERRQQWLRKYKVNNIRDLRAICAQQQLPSPSNILIVCDEFAQLKTHSPQTINQFISIARVGRSLGINLLISSQGASGSITDEIIANCNYRICMHIHNSADSKMVINSNAGVNLSRPGDFILYNSKLDNYIYGRSLLISAEINCKKVYLYNRNLRRELVYEEKGISIIEYILLQMSKLIIQKNPKIIFPPLPTRVKYPQNTCNQKGIKLGVILSESKRTLVNYNIDLSELKNICYATESSESDLCQLIFYQLLMQFKSKECICCIFDIDSWDYYKFKKINHVGLYIQENNHKLILQTLNFLLSLEHLQVIIVINNFHRLTDNQIILDLLFKLIAKDNAISLITTNPAKTSYKVLSTFTNLIINPQVNSSNIPQIKASDFHNNIIENRFIHYQSGIVKNFQGYEFTYPVEFVSMINQTNPKCNQLFKSLPDDLNWENFIQIGKLFIGFNYLDNSQIHLKLKSLIITGSTNSGKTNLLKIIISQYLSYHKVAILDDGLLTLKIFSNHDNAIYQPTNLCNDVPQVIVINKDDFLEKFKYQVKIDILSQIIKLWHQGVIIIFELDKEFIFERNHLINKLIGKIQYHINLCYAKNNINKDLNEKQIGDFILTTNSRVVNGTTSLFEKEE